MSKILVLPGWAVPPEHYQIVIEQAKGIAEFHIRDYGFYSSDRSGNFIFPELDDLSEYTGIVGHSLGACLALHLAKTLPQLKFMVLFSPFAAFTAKDNFPGQPETALTAMQLQLRKSPRKLLRSFFRNMAKPESWQPEIPNELNLETLTSGLDFLSRADCRELLPGLNVPALIFQGNSDLIVTPEMVKTTSELLPEAELKTVSGAGHVLPFTRTGEYKDQMCEFIEKNLPE